MYCGSTSFPWQVSEPLPLLFPLLRVPLPSHLQAQSLPVSTDLPHKVSKGLRAGSTVACWSEHPWPFLLSGPTFFTLNWHPPPSRALSPLLDCGLPLCVVQLTGQYPSACCSPFCALHSLVPHLLEALTSADRRASLYAMTAMSPGRKTSTQVTQRRASTSLWMRTWEGKGRER